MQTLLRECIMGRIRIQSIIKFNKILESTCETKPHKSVKWISKKHQRKARNCRACSTISKPDSSLLSKPKPSNGGSFRSRPSPTKALSLKSSPPWVPQSRNFSVIVHPKRSKRRSSLSPAQPHHLPFEQRRRSEKFSFWLHFSSRSPTC